MEVRHRAAQVPREPGRPQDGPRRRKGERLLGGDHADPLGALPPDRLSGQELVVLVEARREGVANGQHVVTPAVREIGGDAARTDVVVIHPQAGDLLEEGQHRFAVAEAVDHHRDGAQVHPVGGEEQQVGGDAVQLGHEHADPLGPLRHLDPEQPLDSHGEHELVVERRGVVHAGDVGAALQVGEVLSLLLHARVQVADDGLAAQHRLAVELEHETQHAVGAGVLRPHVDDHGLVVGDLDVDVLAGLDPTQDGSLFDGLEIRRGLVAAPDLLGAFGRLPAQVGHGVGALISGPEPP